GGKSLADADKIKKAAKLVADHISRLGKAVVVASAIADDTDTLLELSKNIGITDPSKIDDIVSMGERKSARIIAAAISELVTRTKLVDVESQLWPIVSDNNFGNANVLIEETKTRSRAFASLLHSNDVIVVPGFIAQTTNGCVATLGRGGSDTTAFVMADIIGANQIILVSNVPGIMTADPRLDSTATKIDKIDAVELSYLSDCGKKFIHKKSLLYKPSNINAKLISHDSASLEDEGTIITGSLSAEIKERVR
ncbi:aspartate kinase, partial [Candidatus Micrarchaeota archaeon]|nr:aspartate kinase [Candidatus Micrarchaeota archaeon]